MKRKLVSMLLAAVMICTLPFTAFAAGEEDYDFDPDTGTIMGYYGESTIINIPSSIGGVRVTAIGDSAFEMLSDVTSITVPSSVTSVGTYAFAGCDALKTLNLPSSITTIGEGAFADDYALRTLTLPSSLQELGPMAFSYCTALSSITIPNGVSVIGDDTFSSCETLQRVTLPSSLKSIGLNAFTGCIALTGVTFPEGLETIGDSAFSGCTALTSAVMPSTVKSIGASSFGDCEKLSTVTLNDGITFIGDSAFSSTAVKTVYLPKSIAEMGSGVFDFCEFLTKAYMYANSAAAICKEELIDTQCLYIGDVNADEMVNVCDAILMAREIDGQITNKCEAIVKDYNKDGISDVKDVAEILKNAFIIIE